MWLAPLLGTFFLKQGEKARAIVLMQVLVDYEQSIGHADTEADATQVEELPEQLRAAEDAASPEGDTPAEQPPA